MNALLIISIYLAVFVLESIFATNDCFRWSARSFRLSNPMILEKGAWVPQRLAYSPQRQMIQCTASRHSKTGCHLDKRRKVSVKRRNAWAPATVLHDAEEVDHLVAQRGKVLRSAGDLAVHLPPSWISCFNDQPAQYPVSIDKSWMWISALRCASAISSYTSDSQ